MNAAEDWWLNGPPCMNCGERVLEAKQTHSPGEGFVFEGICKSEVCKLLPPGGNPFMYILSKGDEEE